MRTSALLFDMDGTLNYSTAVVTPVWESFSERHSLDREAVLAHAHQRPTRDTVHRFFDEPELMVAESLRFIKHEESQTDGVADIVGATDFLQSLPLSSRAIVTSASLNNATDVRLNTIGLPTPSTMVCAEDVENKPHPVGHVHAAALLGVRPIDATDFEDSPAGVQVGLDDEARTIDIGNIGTLMLYHDRADRYFVVRGFQVNQNNSNRSITTIDLPEHISGKVI